MHKIFPNSDIDNIIIIVNGIGAKNGISALVTDSLVDLNCMEAGTQSFPLKIFKNQSGDNSQNLFSNEDEVQDGISSDFINLANSKIIDLPRNVKLSCENVFYYVYGVLHSPDYRINYANDLSRELPRIPFNISFNRFNRFSEAGKALADLHLKFQNVDRFPVEFSKEVSLFEQEQPRNYFRVQKMRFGGTRGREDKTTVIYNQEHSA
jgi:predicted helicase